MGLPEEQFDEEQPRLRLVKDGEGSEHDSSLTDQSSPLEVIQGGGEGGGPSSRGQLRVVGSEQSPGTAGGSTTADRKEAANLEDSTGEDTDNPDDDEDEEPAWSFKDFDTNDKSRLNKIRAQWKIYSLAAGSTSLIVTGVIALLGIFVPMRLAFFIKQIEQKVGNIPEYAVERRAEFVLQRYLITRTMEKALGPDFINDERNFVYMKGPFKSLYTNWKGANFEAKLQKDYGIRIKAKPGVDGNINFRNRKYIQPSEWELEDLGVGKASKLRSRGLNNAEVLDFFDTVLAEETHHMSAFKRFRMRSLLARYYGFDNWHFLRDERQAIKDVKLRYVNKKIAIKKKLIQQTVERVSKRYGLYLECLLEGGTKCKNIRKGADPGPKAQASETKTDANGTTTEGPPTDSSGRTGSETINPGNGTSDDVVERALREGEEELAKNAGGEAVDKSFSAFIKEKMGGLITEKVMKTAVAGIGIAEVFYQIVKAVDDGSLSIIQYDRATEQSTAFAQPFLTASDQILSGDDYDEEGVRIMNEVFIGAEKSPVYLSEIAGLDPATGLKQNSVANAAIRGSPKTILASVFDKNALAASGDGGTVSRICEGGDTPQQLPAGELVCDYKKFIQDPAAGIKKNAAWPYIKGIADGYGSTLGQVVDWFNDAVSFAFDITGLDSAVSGLMDFFGIDDLIAKGMAFLMDSIFGFAFTGAEIAEDAFDGLWAGIEANYSGVGGGISVGEGRGNTIGGRVMNAEEVKILNNRTLEKRSRQFANSSLKDRLFSTNLPGSLAYKASSLIPASNATALASAARGLTTSFGSFAQNAGSIFNQKTSASPENGYSSNPFDIIKFGYPADDPALTMDPTELHDTYKCDLPAQDRPQNAESNFKKQGLPFAVPSTTDPCELEVSAVEALTAFNNKDLVGWSNEEKDIAFFDTENMIRDYTENNYAVSPDAEHVLPKKYTYLNSGLLNTSDGNNGTKFFIDTLRKWTNPLKTNAVVGGV